MVIRAGSEAAKEPEQNQHENKNAKDATKAAIAVIASVSSVPAAAPEKEKQNENDYNSGEHDGLPPLNLERSGPDRRVLLVSEVLVGLTGMVKRFVDGVHFRRSGHALKLAHLIDCACHRRARLGKRMMRF